MRFATLIGRLAADVVAFLRDKPFIPCQIDWDYRGTFVEPMFIKDHPPVVTAQDWDDLREDFATMWEDEWP